MRNGEFVNPRLAAIYEAVSPWSEDEMFFVHLVETAQARRVLDLGCGTGRFAVWLADSGHSVTGVDPAPACLSLARAKPSADRVTWLMGTSEVLATAAFDAAVLMNHVAQFLVDDDEWNRTLADLKRALVPGGMLAFDTRDPRARSWVHWNEVESRREVALPHGATVTMWTTLISTVDESVTFEHRYRFSDGAEPISRTTLRFRSEADIRASLSSHGFTIRRVHSTGDAGPMRVRRGELVFVASA